MFALKTLYEPCILWLRLPPDASGDEQQLSGNRPALLGTVSEGVVGEDPSCKWSIVTYSLPTPLLASPLLPSHVRSEAPVFLALQETCLFRCSPFDNRSQWRRLSDASTMWGVHVCVKHWYDLAGQHYLCACIRAYLICMHVCVWFKYPVTEKQMWPHMKTGSGFHYFLTSQVNWLTEDNHNRCKK